MRKIPLRIRFTLVASLFLLVSCVALMLLSNLSAGHIIEAATVMPANTESSMIPIEPPISSSEQYYQVFQKTTALATVIIVLIGSIATYFAAGYVLKPIYTLSNEVRKRNIENLNQPIEIPQSADEIQQLTVAFNQMLEELQRSVTLQKEFSANAAHELRTPLAVMRAKLDVFSMEQNENTAVQEMVTGMGQQLDRLSALIEDLLLFSRNLPMENTEIIPLFPLLSDVADELFNLAAEKKIDVQINPTDCTVLGQDRLLERVFYNLLENAIKYSPSQTVVTVTVQKRENVVQVQIADQGEGIPEVYRDAIFEPFFRIDKSRSRKIGGSGLGLAVCKKILERQNATICVLPNHPTGSIFQLTFPS